MVIKQKKGESRKDYLLRVTIAYLREFSGYIKRPMSYLPRHIIYDGVECDGDSLANDLEAAFDMEEEE